MLNFFVERSISDWLKVLRWPWVCSLHCKSLNVVRQSCCKCEVAERKISASYNNYCEGIILYVLQNKVKAHGIVT